MPRGRRLKQVHRQDRKQWFERMPEAGLHEDRVIRQRQQHLPQQRPVPDPTQQQVPQLGMEFLLLQEGYLESAQEERRHGHFLKWSDRT